MMYFFHSIGSGAVKIGYTGDPSPKRRLAKLRTGSPHELQCIASFPEATLEDERSAHQLMRKDRIRGEWFSEEAASRLLAFRREYHSWPWNSNALLVKWSDQWSHEATIERLQEERRALKELNESQERVIEKLEEQRRLAREENKQIFDAYTGAHDQFMDLALKKLKKEQEAPRTSGTPQNRSGLGKLEAIVVGTVGFLLATIAFVSFFDPVQ